MALIDKITAIAVAIREKTGTEDKLTLEQMATAIAGIETGGGSGVESIPITKGNSTFMDNAWSFVLEDFADKVEANITDGCSHMFKNTTCVDRIGFIINIADSLTSVSCAGMFAGSTIMPTAEEIAPLQGKISSISNMFDGNKSTKPIPALTIKEGSKVCGSTLFQNYKGTEIGTITNFTHDGTYCYSMFYGCNNLRYLPEFVNLDMSGMATATYYRQAMMFGNCWSLREIPADVMKWLCSPQISSGNYGVMYDCFTNCFVLDELVNIPFSIERSSQLSNYFNDTCLSNCYRLKNITFETNEDGTPKFAKVRECKISAHKVGYCHKTSSDDADGSAITSHNSGITEDKRVVDDESYQRLKNDPDWWTTDIRYSRYNLESAIATINSLPDTVVSSSQSNINSITFGNNQGALTDGGSCGDLTAEQIAIASAKDWTVALVKGYGSHAI